MQGILFKPAMIKAIARGKSVTRRAIKLPHTCDSVRNGINTWVAYEALGIYQEYIKPRYQVGDTVYIKEKFIYRFGHHPDIFYIKYCSDGEELKQKLAIYFPWDKAAKQCYTKLDGSPNTVSPLFMPAWAARYHIKITDVRAERTSDISHEDCILEGIISAGGCYWSADDGVAFNTAREAYFYLYDSINGKGKHKNNWDWRYTFSLLPEGDDNSK